MRHKRPYKTPSFSSPTKKLSATVTNLDAFDKRMARTVLGFYKRHKILTLHEIKQEVKGVAEATTVLTQKAWPVDFLAGPAQPDCIAVLL